MAPDPSTPRTGDRRLCRVEVDLVEYTVNAVVEGIESLAQTRVSIRERSNDAGAMMKAACRLAAWRRGRSWRRARTPTSWCLARARGGAQPHDLFMRSNRRLSRPSGHRHHRGGGGEEGGCGVNFCAFSSPRRRAARPPRPFL